MDISLKDITISVIVHILIIAMISLLNPFAVVHRPDLDAVRVNLIEMPPLGSPDVAPLEAPEITIPQATIEDIAEMPISMPESRKEKQEIEKPEPPQPKPKPREDQGYKGMAEVSDSAQKGGTDVSDQLGPGTKFGAVAVDNPNFNYPYYFVQALGKIQRNWSNPVASRSKLACVISFKIIRSGTVLSPEITKSSGIDAYDRACLRAVQAASPLPPLPPDFRDDIIGINLEFPYEPR